jgi:hypothetical protein
MNFLGIEQVSVINFILKINFHNDLFIFTDSRLRAILSESTGVNAKVPRLSVPDSGLWVHSSKLRGFICVRVRLKGYRSTSVVRSEMSA